MRDITPVFALAMFAILIAPPTPPARPHSHSASIHPAADYIQTADGLQQQYQQFLDAFAAGKSAQIDQAFDIFAVPNPATWFRKYFAPEEVEQLARDNESELDAYKSVLLRGLSAVPAGTRFRVKCKPPHASPSTRMQPRPGAAQPLVPIPVEQFVTEFDPIPKLKYGKFSMVVNYVYVGGAFRYVGKGAYPFWSTPEASQKK